MMNREQMTRMDTLPKAERAALRTRCRQVFARALAEDPLSRHAFPEPDSRVSRLAWLYGKILDYGMRHGRVYAADEGRAVAVWLPPERPQMTIWRVVLVGFLILPLKVGWRGFRRLNAYDHVKTSLHRRTVAGPHWYLAVIAVDPAAQGSGYGRRLLEPIAEDADRRGIPCFLETSNEKNIEYFKRHGYELRGHAEVIPNDLQVWAMVREPTSPSRPSPPAETAGRDNFPKK